MSICKFKFGTKAFNLIKLKELLKYGFIEECYVLTIGEWIENKDTCISYIKQKYLGKKIIVRSSTPIEDTHGASMAGAFDSIANVNSGNCLEIESAINKVADSYKRYNDHIDDYEILIQNMVENVVASGVVFTRNIENLSSYYVINYEETNKTDTVTAGYGNGQKILYLHKNVDENKLEPRMMKLLKAIREIENVTNNDRLDIEFAIDKNYDIHVLQVRPLVVKQILLSSKIDTIIEEEIKNIENFIKDKFEKDLCIYGDTTIYAQMPDWNPAEIIGTNPSPLSFSLYRYLIMESAWRISRSHMGYNNPFPNELMINVAGRPYVDVRNSFNSLIPSGLGEELSNKLINYYIDVLAKNPEYHDKVEFKILISCFTFKFDEESKKLIENGFTYDEVNKIREKLFNLTNEIIIDKNGLLSELSARVKEMKIRRQKILSSFNKIDNIPWITQKLLQDCIYYGTIPFSVFARCAFIGSSFLKSLVELDILSEDEMNNFYRSIDTVATEMLLDIHGLSERNISLDNFLDKYGHLRPGTYDIKTYTYREKTNEYLDLSNQNRKMELIENHEFNLTKKQKEVINSLINKYGFDFDVEELFDFISKSIQYREYVKFEFTKNLSSALDLIARYGEFHGFTREELSYLNIEDILIYSNKSFNNLSVEKLRLIIEKNREEERIMTYINLPDLIINVDDLRIINYRKKKPNFITTKEITKKFICLDNYKGDLSDIDFDDKIILIENADPGYDWIFTRKIGGLITKFGGAASHMAIRCAEFGLPAAIGCGEKIYKEIQTRSKICLNCMEKKVYTYEVSY